MHTEFEYKLHQDRYRALFAINPETNRETVIAAENNAKHDHALAVFNPLRDSYSSVVRLAGVLKSEQAKFYMLYGAGRRLSMIFHAYRRLIFTADPKRDKPLSHDEQQELSLDINVLYMHALGVLDNYAWCFLFEKHPDRADDIDKRQVGLFSKEFRKICPTFVSISFEIDVHKGWFEELKDKRDPVAHRIPLYIPNAAIEPTDVPAYNRLYESFLENSAQKKFEEADVVFAALNQIGRFVHGFVHHPEGGVIPIYPTIPNDMGHLIQIGAVIKSVLCEANEV